MAEEGGVGQGAIEREASWQRRGGDGTKKLQEQSVMGPPLPTLAAKDQGSLWISDVGN